MTAISDFGTTPSETTSPVLPQANGFTNNNVESVKKDFSTSPSEHSSDPQKQSASPASSSLNSRSCVTCRKRKVKCDKRHPCSNCNKAAIECVFPGPGRAPRRSRKPHDTELLARLRRLEGVVQTLGRGIEEDGGGHNETTAEGQGPVQAELTAQGLGNIEKSITEEQKEAKRKDWCGKMMTMHEPSKAEAHATNGLVKDLGRLVVDEGRSRYVSNKFWNSLSEEVAELQDILDDPTDDEDDYPSPGLGEAASANHQGFIFSFSSTILSLRNFYPPIEQIGLYWDIYKSNIAPVMKLLHTPHTENLIIQASKDLDHVTKAQEALLFSIFYAVVTSIPDDGVFVLLGVDRQATLQKYRFACEQSFARAGFLNTQDIMVLQALVLFLIAVRRSDDTRYVWTLTGLLIRLEHSLGVHRDGAQFGLPPFETELRRRLWWQTVSLDSRASEDHGCDPSVGEMSFDTKFPLNINDEDISPATTVAPPEHEGATEMTFDLIRYSVSTTMRRLSYAPATAGCRSKAASFTLEHKEHLIEELHQYIEKKFLRYLDTSIPLHWVSATVARLIMAKMWLVVHHPLQRSDGGAGLPQETRDRLFITSVEVIEFSRLLETENATLKWGWLFRTYVQWHALAFALSQLCIRTEGPEVDKAWCVIDGVFDEWGGGGGSSSGSGSNGLPSSNQRGMMWKPLRKLMLRARQARQHAMEHRARFPLDGSLGPAAMGITAPLVTQPGPLMNASAASSGGGSSVPFSEPGPLDAFLPTLSNGNVNGTIDDYADLTLPNGDGTGGSSNDPGNINPYVQQQQQQPQQPSMPHPNAAFSHFNENINNIALDPWQFSNNNNTTTAAANPSNVTISTTAANPSSNITATTTSANPTNLSITTTANNNNNDMDKPHLLSTAQDDDGDDTLMAANWAGWDDMVKEFQLDGAAGWPASGAFENMAL